MKTFLITHSTANQGSTWTDKTWSGSLCEAWKAIWSTGGGTVTRSWVRQQKRRRLSIIDEPPTSGTSREWFRTLFQMDNSREDQLWIIESLKPCQKSAQWGFWVLALKRWVRQIIENSELFSSQGEKGQPEAVKLSEYTEEDLLKAFRKESYALGELNHLKTRQRIVRYRRQHALVVFD